MTANNHLTGAMLVTDSTASFANTFGEPPFLIQIEDEVMAVTGFSAGVFTLDRSPQAAAIIASDSFLRPATTPLDSVTDTLGTAWGRAEKGGAWWTQEDPGSGGGPPTMNIGTAADGTGYGAYNVTGTSLNPLLSYAWLPYVNSTHNVESVVRFQVDTLPAAGYLSVRVDQRAQPQQGNEYYGLESRLRSDGTWDLYLVFTNSNIAGPVNVAGATAGEPWTVRFQTSGINTVRLRARIWKSSTAEPSTWSFDTTHTPAAVDAQYLYGTTRLAFQQPTTYTGPATNLIRIPAVQWQTYSVPAAHAINTPIYAYSQPPGAYDPGDIMVANPGGVPDVLKVLGAAKDTPLVIGPAGLPTWGATGARSVGLLDPGTASVDTEQFLLQYGHLKLAGTERLTLVGTGELVLSSFGEAATELVLGSPKTPSASFTLPTDYFLDVIRELALVNAMRATLRGTADLIITDDFGTRSRLVLAGRG